MTWLKKVKKIPNSVAIVLIRIYQVIFSPSTGWLRHLSIYPKPSCIFYPTCSEYALQCFKKYSFMSASKKTIHRLGRCHPYNDPQIDLP